MKKKIVMIGSYVADLTGVAEHLPKAAETVFGEQFKIGPGGKGSNQAVAAHKAGADITLVTKIGDDVFGKLALDFYKEQGIDTEHIILDKENGTGVALICVDGQTKQNQILVVPNACAHFTDSDIERLIPLIKSADILLVQFEINMDALEKIISAAWEAGVFIILNPAPVQDADRELLSKVDLITPNEIEAGAITGTDVADEQGARDAARIFHEWGIPQVVITMGKSGAFASADGKSRMIPAIPVKAVDTTGAGDAFNGGLATAISEGMDLFKAAEFGAALASLSVQKFGTAPSMPDRAEIDRIFSAE